MEFQLSKLEQMQEKTIAVGKKKISNRSIIYASIGAVVIVALAGFIVSGGLLPNVNKNTSSSLTSDRGTVVWIARHRFIGNST